MFTRQLHKHKIQTSKLFFKEYGDPLKVLQQLNEPLEFELSANQVLVKMIAFPVNPQDFSLIQGTGPIKRALPCIPGSEGYGEVLQIGSEVKSLEIGDRVVPIKCNTGTWRSHFLCDGHHLQKVPKDLGLVESATLTVNPCTAYRLLHDFNSLKPGDVLIQNGANSQVGVNIIQLSRIMNIKTVNIVGSQDLKLKQNLKDLGGDFVLTEDELQETNIFNLEVNKPKLGLNCLGGQSCLAIIKPLDKNSILVTYGDLSGEPVIIPSNSLIFKKLTATGFWLNDWLEGNDSNKKQQMYDDIIKLMVSGELKGPDARIIPFNQYKEAINQKGIEGEKFILRFDDLKPK